MEVQLFRPYFVAIFPDISPNLALASMTSEEIAWPELLTIRPHFGP